jgi:ABC-type multidrug transport system fused ATPase/permease subunit
MTTAAISFDRVTKAFGTVRAVDEVSFSLPQGALVTLLGPSGCGKTTTLRLVAGLELPSEGRITIEGRDVTRLAAAERRIAMVFQSYALFPHMNVQENVAYGLVVNGARKASAEADALSMLKTLGLEGLGHRLPAIRRVLADERVGGGDLGAGDHHRHPRGPLRQPRGEPLDGVLHGVAIGFDREVGERLVCEGERRVGRRGSRCRRLAARGRRGRG